jgi:hypothetical protein
MFCMSEFFDNFIHVDIRGDSEKPRLPPVKISFHSVYQQFLLRSWFSYIN